MDMVNAVMQLMLAGVTLCTVRALWLARSSREVSVLQPLVVTCSSGFYLVLFLRAGYVWSILPAILMFFSATAWLCLVVMFRKAKGVKAR